MSSRFRNLGPRDRRMNSQWPDFPQVYGDSVRIKSTKCLEPLEGLQKRKGILEDLIFLTLHQNVVQTIKNGIKNLLGKDKAPSPGVSCPWKFRWWGHVRAIRGALYLLQSHRNFHLPEPPQVPSLPSLQPSWPLHPASRCPPETPSWAPGLPGVC